MTIITSDPLLQTLVWGYIKDDNDNPIQGATVRFRAKSAHLDANVFQIDQTVTSDVDGRYQATMARTEDLGIVIEVIGKYINPSTGKTITFTEFIVTGSTTPVSVQAARASVTPTKVITGGPQGPTGLTGATGPAGPGGGDVSKVGTPVDNQIGVWTGDGTIEGEANFTYDSTLGHLEFTGEMDILHTAVAEDEHALEIVCDAAGFGDVKALDIDYITGAMGTGDEEGVILINIDESLSSGGSICGLEVLATGEGSAIKCGTLFGIGVDPVAQFSGVFVDPDSALVITTDRLTEFTTAGSDIEFFTADNDTITIGNAAKFSELEFLLATVASKNCQITFEYSTGVGTFSSFTPVDGTNGMLNNGVIAWMDADLPGWAVDVNTEFTIKMTRTRNGGITSPIESKVQLAEAIVYAWDKDGVLNVKEIQADTLTIDGYIKTHITQMSHELGFAYGGTPVAGALTIRTLNTTQHFGDILTTLNLSTMKWVHTKLGTYRMSVRAAIFDANQWRHELRNTTDVTKVVQVNGGYNGSSDAQCFGDANTFIYNVDDLADEYGLYYHFQTASTNGLGYIPDNDNPATSTNTYVTIVLEYLGTGTITTV